MNFTISLPNYMNKSLSNTDIKRKLGGQVRIMSYRDIYKYKDIDSMLGKYGAVALLYETKERYGHWVAIFKTFDPKSGEPIISFFDPYSIPVDHELDFIDDDFKIENNVVYPYLSELLYKSPYQIEYNEHKLQKFKPGINTCGRWVIARLLFRNLPLDEFNELFASDNYITSDELVTIFTENI